MLWKGLNYNETHDLLLEPRKPILAKVLVEREMPKQSVEVGEVAEALALSSSSSPLKSKDEPKLRKRLLPCFSIGTTLEEWSEVDHREDGEVGEEGERMFFFLRFSFGKSAKKMFFVPLHPCLKWLPIF